jgi:membrane associated rhomboid family serine protease
LFVCENPYLVPAFVPITVENMRIQYNSPVILTFTLLSTLVFVLQFFTPFQVIDYFTIVPSEWSWSNPVSYLSLVSHILGHGGNGAATEEAWAHLMGNFTIILLIGPILEEKYGSRDLLFMILATALLTGILQVSFFKTGLLGASGIVFMMIILGSFTNSRMGTIPMTFILVALLFLGQEIYRSFGEDNVSQFAHIIGGICGGVFGFLLEGGAKKKIPVVPKSGI